MELINCWKDVVYTINILIFFVLWDIPYNKYNAVRTNGCCSIYSHERYINLSGFVLLIYQSVNHVDTSNLKFELLHDYLILLLWWTTNLL